MFRCSDDLLRPAVSFCAVLDLRFCYRLPFHIGRNISATTFERNDVIHDVASPAFGISRPPHEVGSCRGASLDLAVAAPRLRFRFDTSIVVSLRSSSCLSPDRVIPGVFLPRSRPCLLDKAAEGGLEPAPPSRFRGADPHQLTSCAPPQLFSRLLCSWHTVTAKP